MAEVYDKIIQRPTTLYLRRLTRKQQKTLREFDEYNESKNWKRNTRVCQVKTIGHLGDDVKKEYQDMTKEDVNNWLNNKNIIPNSRQTYQLYLQKFLKWLGKDINDGLKKLKTPIIKQSPHPIYGR